MYIQLSCVFTVCDIVDIVSTFLPLLTVIVHVLLYNCIKGYKVYEIVFKLLKTTILQAADYRLAFHTTDTNKKWNIMSKNIIV